MASGHYTVKTGDDAPDFTLPDAHGNPVHLADLRGRWVVLFFYPKDGTPGCRREACSFRDAYADFTAAGATVLGISADAAASHQRFTRRHALPFALLCDEGGRVRQRYGVPKILGLLSGRVTYVIDPHGIIHHVFSSLFDAQAHVQEALKMLPGAAT